jgi:hypothetical protein
VSQREHGSQSHALERINSASCIVCGIGLYSTARAGVQIGTAANCRHSFADKSMYVSRRSIPDCLL